MSLVCLFDVIHELTRFLHYLRYFLVQLKYVDLLESRASLVVGKLIMRLNKRLYLLPQLLFPLLCKVLV